MSSLALAPPLSPYLPGTVIRYAWDATSISALKKCPRFYQLEIEEGWRPKGENINLRFGLEYHQCIQEYEIAKAQGQNHDQALFTAIKALVRRLKNYPDPGDKRSQALKTRHTLFRTAVWYLDQFKKDAAKTVILDNKKPAVELSFRFELTYGPGPNHPYLLCGHLDRVVTFGGDVYLMDHKTATTTLGSYYFDQFEPDNQMTLYTIAAKVVFGSPVKGVIIDAAQIAQDWSRFVRGFTYRTPDQLTEWMADLRYWLGQAEAFAKADYWPQNDTACDKYGGCRFRGICSKDPKVRKEFLRADFIQLSPEERWNPLKPR